MDSLWETYALTSSVLQPSLGLHAAAAAALSGAVAGGTQALLAAPAENVRLVLDSNSGASWSVAWKEVFRGTKPLSSDITQREHVRQVRDWTKEVKGMAGRGWDGLWWGCAKDICGEFQVFMSGIGVFLLITGFAAFFSIFEISRRVASRTKIASRDAIESRKYGEGHKQSLMCHLPRTVHGVILVAGGVVAGLAYELLSRPFDIARKAVQQDKVIHPIIHGSTMKAIMRKTREDGIASFFRDPSRAESKSAPGNAGGRKLYAMLRTLARVGPWGMGFLVWEALGPGIS